MKNDALRKSSLQIQDVIYGNVIFFWYFCTKPKMKMEIVID